jgi:hypothetical protein
MHLPAGLCVQAVVFYFAGVAGNSSKRPGFKKPDGPEIFIEAEFVFFVHNTKLIQPAGFYR